jgi:hypothetical protein
METLNNSKDAQERKAAADSLRQQIEDLVSGRGVPKKPSNLRDFVENKMAEDRRQRHKADAAATGENTPGPAKL